MGEMIKARISGIYKIENTTTGEFYIGSSVDIQKRWKSHNSDLCAGRHCNCYLQCLWDKYGKDSFVWVILEETESIRMSLIEREQFYIEAFHPTLNINPFATNNMGRTLSEETKRKIASSHIGIMADEESRAKMRLACVGRLFSEETREKLSFASRTRKRAPQSEETRRKIALARIGQPSPRKGVVLTAEQKHKCSESAKARWTRKRAEGLAFCPPL